MERYRQELTRIRNLLRAHPRGLTITDISHRIGVNRNSVAKYLDVLITSGHVEMKAVGPAKVYFLSSRVPVSALLNLSSDYIIILDEKGKIWHVNNSLLAFEGLTREEVLGRDFDDAPLMLLRDPEVRSRLSHGAPEREFSFEADVKKGDEIHHFRTTLVCTILEDGSRGTTVIFQDITEEKRNAESLRASEARYRAVVESQTEFVCRFRPDGTHVFVNEAYCRYFGKARDEIVGHVFRPEIPKEDRDALRKHFEGFTPEHPLGSIEHRILMPDGSVRWQRWIDRAIFDDGGRITEFQSVGRDTTDRRVAEERLQESEERFRNIAERAFDIILLLDGEGRITYASPSLRQSTGYDPAEVTGKPIFTFIHAPDIPRATLAFDRVRQGQPPKGIEIRVKKKDGSAGTFEIRTTPLMKNGSFGGIEAICRDVTARVLAEDSLRESLEKTRSVFEASPDGICLTDETGILLEANRAVETITGIPRAEAIGKPIWEIATRLLPRTMMPPGGPDRMRTDFQLFLSTGVSPHLQEPLEFGIQHPDGSSRVVHIRSFVIPSKKGYRMGSIIRDITDRKKMEDELRTTARNLGERVKELRCLYSISSILNRQDLPFRTILQEVCTTLPSGMQVPGLCCARIRIDGKEWISPGFSETPWKISQEIAGGAGFTGSIDVCCRPGECGSGTILFLEEERELLKEVALRLSEAREHRCNDEMRSRLASIVECAEEAIIGKSLDGTILSWNRAAERMYGYPAHEVIGKPISLLLPQGYPNDIPAILERIRQGEQMDHFETRRMRKDGNVIRVSLTISPVRDSTGMVTGISTIARELSPFP